MKKIMFALGGAGVAGAGGYYAKQMTGAAVGALAGGVVGYLLARCETVIPGRTAFSVLPGGGTRMFSPTAAQSPISRISSPSTPQMSTECPAGKYRNPITNQCMDYVK